MSTARFGLFDSIWRSFAGCCIAGIIINLIIIGSIEIEKPALPLALYIGVAIFMSITLISCTAKRIKKKKLKPSEYIGYSIRQFATILIMSILWLPITIFILAREIDMQDKDYDGNV